MAEYAAFLAAPPDERRGAFLRTAARLSTGEGNVEKDFWVCWTLDALFHRLAGNQPRLLFKGGTSLSKGYNLISRFFRRMSMSPSSATIWDNLRRSTTWKH